MSSSARTPATYPGAARESTRPGGADPGSIDPLDRPTRLAAREDHPSLVSVAGSDEVRAILHRAWPVVHQDEGEFVVAPAWARLLQAGANRLLEDRPVPSLVRRARLLECAIGRGEVASVVMHVNAP